LSLPDTDHVPPAPGQPLQAPLRTTAVVLYATLAALALAIPQAAVNRLKDAEPNLLQDIALDAAFAVQSFSNRMGFDLPFYNARRAFLDASGKRED